jgi:hypothetical protein
VKVLRTLSPLARWTVLIGVVVLGLMAAGVILLIIKFPFSEASVTALLQRESSGTVHIRRFNRVYFPPGFAAEGVIIALPGVAGPPLINIGRASVAATYAGLLSKPERISSIRLEHFIVHIPKHAGAANGKKTSKADEVVIENVNADHAQLEFGSDTAFNIHHLALGNVAKSRRLSFDAALGIPEPPGEVTARGTFGPWHGAQTPVAGAYKFRHADLGRFKGLGGYLASDGHFSGPISAIHVEGWTDVPDFEANNSGHPVRLRTRFQGRVDGPKGDVYLDRVDASFRRTEVLAHGAVKDKQGTSLQLDIPRARIEDFLSMLLRSSTPGLFGYFQARVVAELPAGDEKFIRKLRLRGDFGVSGASFGSPQTQQGVDRLSQRAEGEKQNEDPTRVFSDLKGHVDLRDGIARLSNISFTVPGARIRLHGTYDLPREYVHLDGTLHMQATVSQASHGVVSFLLKPLDRLFRKKNHVHGADLDIHITGPYGHTGVHVSPMPTRISGD